MSVLVNEWVCLLLRYSIRVIRAIPTKATKIICRTMIVTIRERREENQTCLVCALINGFMLQRLVSFIIEVKRFTRDTAYGKQISKRKQKLIIFSSYDLLSSSILCTYFCDFFRMLEFLIAKWVHRNLWIDSETIFSKWRVHMNGSTKADLSKMIFFLFCCEIHRQTIHNLDPFTH